MKKSLIVLSTLLLFCLFGCSNPSSHPEDTLQADVESQEQPLVPEVIPAIELSLPTEVEPTDISIPLSSFPDEYYVAPEYFNWEGYIPVIKSNEEHGILDSNISDLEDAHALYGKYAKANGKEPVPDKKYYYNGMPAKVAGNGLILSLSDKEGKFSTAYIYSPEGEFLFSLRLPKSVDYDFPNKTRDSSEASYVINDKLVLITFYSDSLEWGTEKYTRSSNRIFLYDHSDQSLVMLASNAFNPQLSPDCRYLIYSQRLTTMNNFTKYTQRAGNVLYVKDLVNKTTTKFTKNGNQAVSLSAVRWIDKNEFYKFIGEPAPVQKKTYVTLFDEKDDPQKPLNQGDASVPKDEENSKVTIEVPLDQGDASNEDFCEIAIEQPSDLTCDEFVLPQSSKSFTFGQYVPFLNRTVTYADTEYINEDFAFITDDTETLDDGIQLYEKFNRNYLVTPTIVDESGKSLAQYPFFKSKVVDLSPDFTKVLVSAKSIPFQPDLIRTGNFLYYEYFSSPNYTVYENGIKKKSYLKVSNNSLDSLEQLLGQDEGASQEEEIIYNAPGTLAYVGKEKIIFYTSNTINVYSTKEYKKIRSIKFSVNEDNYDKAEPGEMYISSARINSVNEKYALIIYTRAVRLHDGDCSCGVKDRSDCALYLFDMETEAFTCLTDHYLSFDVSPDMKYVAYTYNDCEERYDKTANGTDYYEKFTGGVVVKNIETQELVALPYTLVSRNYEMTPTAVWSVIKWVDKNELEKQLTLTKDPPVQAVHVVPDADSKTIIKELAIPDNLVRDTNAPRPTGDFSFGDYLPLIKFPSPKYENALGFDSFAILENDTIIAEGTKTLYDAINLKFSDRFEPSEYLTSTKLSDFLFKSRVIYISSDASEVATFGLIDKGKVDESANWTTRNWGSVYKLYKNGVTEYTERKEDVSFGKLSLGEYYSNNLTREYSYTQNDTDFRICVDGLYHNDVYRDENFRVYSITENDLPVLIVYSIKDDRITHRFTLPERRFASSESSSIIYELEQIIDEKYFLFAITEKYYESPKTYNSKTSRGLYLYDAEANEYKYLASNIDNALISPDLKYLIGNEMIEVRYGYENKDYYSFFAIDLESKNIGCFNVPCADVYKTFDSTYSRNHNYSLETVNWINEDQLIKAIYE
ncbi:MAG: hypothetical protein IKL05_04065 [Clostridia bacterium]|nr:hypothetical protein [Clostridia bacterium]